VLFRSLFIQAFVAAACGVGRLDLDHVPGHLLGLDHGLDLGLLAVVFHGHDLVALLFIGLVERLFLRIGIGAAEVHDGELLLCKAGQGDQAGGQGCAGDEALFHGADFLG